MVLLPGSADACHDRYGADANKCTPIPVYPDVHFDRSLPGVEKINAKKLTSR
jgi:hypothetical protein